MCDDIDLPGSAVTQYPHHVLSKGLCTGIHPFALGHLGVENPMAFFHQHRADAFEIVKFVGGFIVAIIQTKGVAPNSIESANAMG
jgi:hypothetical protein